MGLEVIGREQQLKAAQLLFEHPGGAGALLLEGDRSVPGAIDRTTGDPLTVRGKVFIDATYEGDLLASAGYDDTIRLWDIRSALRPESVPAHDVRVRQMMLAGR